MKIFKYILLLLLLFSFAFFVFVFTKDGSYSFEERMSINLDKSFVLPYIDNHDLWEKWFHFDQPIDDINVNDESFTWADGKNQIIKNRFNDSINYKLIINDLSTITNFKILENNHTTEVIWQGEGKMTFKEKLFYYLPFQESAPMPLRIKSSLSNLKNILTQRYLKHEILFNDVQLLTSQDYFTIPFDSKNDDLLVNFQAVSQKADSILNLKSITKTNEPFIIYAYQNQLDSTSTFTYATAVKMDSLFYVSKIKLLSTKSFQAIKVTLKGNYKFKSNVFKTLDSHLKKIKHEKSKDGFIIEKQIKGFKDKLPENEWLTEFYFPIAPQIENQPVSNINPTSIRKNDADESRKTIQPIELMAVPNEQPNENLFNETQD